jgi:hypothetical protein
VWYGYRRTTSFLGLTTDPDGGIMESATWGAIPARGEPTAAGPGTEPKILVMIERAMRREPLFHPLDGLRHRLRQPLVPERVERLESA